MFSTSEWLLRMLQAKLIKIDKLKYPRNEVKNLYFPSGFDILMEIRLSGLAMRLIWEMSVYRNNLTLPPATIVRH